MFNQLFIISYLGYEYHYGDVMGLADVLPLTLISIIILDVIYIGCMNIKNSRILSRFSTLLILIIWYYLWALDGKGIFLTMLSLAGPLIFYATITFVLVFFFQESAYTFQKETDIILKISCLLTLLTKFINNRLFALLYLIQLFLGIIICIFLFCIHRKRILFVLKNEWKNFLYSSMLVIIVFTFYVVCFGSNPKYVENLGAYLILFLPLFSIHSITFKNHKKTSSILFLDSKYIMILISSFIGLLMFLTFIMKFTVGEVFIIVHAALTLVLVYYILLYSHTRKYMSLSNFKNVSYLQNGFYMYGITQIKREEDLKRDFSNYLHDEILQDLLSIKNMMKKSDRPDVHNLMMQTLESLNISIREQMQEYHPSIIKTFTLKENFQNLLDMLENTYSNKNFQIFFDCDDKISLVEPYNFIVYRILKELTVNALKHSKGSQVNVILLQNKEQVDLVVQDNGVGLLGDFCFNKGNHKGLNSIQEQLDLINGKIETTASEPCGLRVTVKFSMEGENSYAYFINR